MKRAGVQRAGARRPVQAVRVTLRLMRVTRPLCAALFVFLGAWLAAPAQALWSARVLAAAACVGSIAAFGFVINDCRDVAADAIARPERPLPARQVTLPQAQALAFALAMLGLVLGLVLGGAPAAIATGAVVFSAWYSYRLKQTVLLGNLCVALLVAGVVVFGAVVAGGTTPAVWAAAAITFSFIAAQEIVFTLDDEGSDRAAGLTTTATVLGAARTARLAQALLVIFAAVGIAPWLGGMTTAVYAIAFAAASLAPAAALWWWLRAPVDPQRVARAVRWSRLIWVTGFVPLSLLK